MPTHAGPIRIDELAATLPDSAWQTYSAGPGSERPSYHAWAWVVLLPEDDAHPDVEQIGQHHLLIRRTDSTGELAH